jgi:long-chain acyl-CoA synthetase
VRVPAPERDAREGRNGKPFRSGDERSGEKVTAFVVAGLNPPSEADVIAHCRKTLSAYKVPGSVQFVDELPKSPIGKILRRELRAQVIASISNKKG